MRHADEQRQREPKKQPNQMTQRRQGLFIPIHLLEEEKKAIRDGTYDLYKAVERIEGYVGSGHSIKIKLRADGNSYVATLSQGNVEWDKAINLSAFHQSVEKALVTLGMALEDRYEQFPELAPAVSQLTFDY